MRSASAFADALERVRRLEEAAIALAEAGLGASGGRRELTRESLAARFPGFAESAYGCAVNDGFILTRN